MQRTGYRLAFGMLLAALVGVSLARSATLYWIGGTGNTWDTSTSNLMWSSTWPDSDDKYYTAGDTVIFYRDVLTANKTFTVQAGGVSPASFRIDTNGTWNISGGLINGPMSYYDSSGGGSTVNFNSYTTSLGFTTMVIKAFGANVNYNYAGAPGSVHMTTGGITIDLSSATGGGIKFNPTSATAGTYTLTDNLTLNNLHNNYIRAGGGTAGKLIVFSGNVAMNQNLYCDSDTGTADMYFTGTLTVSGARTINQNMNNGGGFSQAHFEDATFAGGAGTSLTFTTTNAGARGYVLPTAGTRVNVGGLTVRDANVRVNPTTATDDYFAALRGNSGTVTVDGYGSYGNWLYLQRGSYRSSDFATINGGRLTLDQRTSNENLTLAGSGGSGPFLIGGAGNNLTTAYVAMDGNGGNGIGSTAGDVQVSNGGMVVLNVPAFNSDTWSVTGNIRLTGGSTLLRFINTGGNDDPRTVRVLLPGANTLLLGDGSAATAETITLRGGPFGSGGPNEAWGFNVNAGNVTDDGNVTLRYEMTPARAPQTAPLDKYCMDWRDSAGAVLAFRGGSAGTQFAPHASLTVNGGFVARGPAAGTVFTTSGAASLETAGLLSFATNLANQGVLPTLGAVVVDGVNASFITKVAGGTVRASQITVQNGGTIGGSGTFEAPVTVASGTLAPGNSAGTLTVNGNVNLQAGSTMAVELNGTMPGTGHDQLVANGTVTLGSGALTVQMGYEPALNDPLETFTILVNDLADAISGTFAQGSSVTLGGYGRYYTGTAQINYAGGTGNDIVLSNLHMIPEPGALALLALAAGAGLARRRR